MRKIILTTFAGAVFLLASFVSTTANDTHCFFFCWGSSWQEKAPSVEKDNWDNPEWSTVKVHKHHRHHRRHRHRHVQPHHRLSPNEKAPPVNGYVPPLPGHYGGI